MNTYQVKINGKMIEVEVEMLEGSPVVTAVQPKSVQALHRDTATPAARPVSAQAPVMEKSAAAAAADEGKAVTAPMPGNILDVLVKIGDAVKKGQTLLVFEAMKMENEIQAGTDGVIADICVGKGTVINTGDVLVTFA